MTSNSAKHISWLTLKIFFALTGFCLIFGISALLFIRTDTGRELTRTQLNQLLSKQIKGKFELKHLDELAFDRIAARGMVITAPNGEKVIELQKIYMIPVWSKLLIGQVEASSATVTGGVIRIREVKPSLSIVQATNSPLKPEDRKGEPIPIVFNNITTTDLEVLIKLHKFPLISIKNISSLIDFKSAERRVTIKLEKTNAHANFPVLGDTKIRQLNGLVKSKVREVINFKLNMELGQLVPTHLTYLVPKNEGKPGKSKMVIRFSKDKSPSFFSKLILDAADTISPVIDVGFEQ